MLKQAETTLIDSSWPRATPRWPPDRPVWPRMNVQLRKWVLALHSWQRAAGSLVVLGAVAHFHLSLLAATRWPLEAGVEGRSPVRSRTWVSALPYRDMAAYHRHSCRNTDIPHLAAASQTRLESRPGAAS